MSHVPTGSDQGLAGAMMSRERWIFRTPHRAVRMRGAT
jgi:hypothetical protein